MLPVGHVTKNHVTSDLGREWGYGGGNGSGDGSGGWWMLPCGRRLGIQVGRMTTVSSLSSPGCGFGCGRGGWCRHAPGCVSASLPPSSFPMGTRVGACGGVPLSLRGEWRLWGGGLTGLVPRLSSLVSSPHLLLLSSPSFPPLPSFPARVVRSSHWAAACG